MRIVITENITVDGVIDLSDGWFAPATGAAEDADHLAVLQEQDRTADAMLLGRHTFEDFRGYWPKQTDDPTGISDYLNRVPKYVVSSTLDDPGWEPTTVLRGPLDDEIAALKAAPGADIVVTGSLTLVPDLIARGVVDEYRLFVYPVWLGRGRRLTDVAVSFRTLESRSLRSGVTWLRLQPSK